MTEFSRTVSGNIIKKTRFARCIQHESNQWDGGNQGRGRLLEKQYMLQWVGPTKERVPCSDWVISENQVTDRRVAGWSLGIAKTSL